jgi:hypothetical protein
MIGLTLDTEHQGEDEEMTTIENNPNKRKKLKLIFFEVKI